MMVLQLAFLGSDPVAVAMDAWALGAVLNQARSRLAVDLEDVNGVLVGAILEVLGNPAAAHNNDKRKDSGSLTQGAGI